MRYLCRTVSCALFSVVLALSSCATAPIVETKAFAEATSAVRSATDTLWAEFSVAEKREGQIRIQRGVLRNQFAVDDAYYYTTIDDSPTVLVLKKSLLIVQQYADLLVTLVDGSRTEEARGQMVVLAANLAELGGLSGVPKALSELTGIIDRAIVAAHVSEAKRLVISGAPYVREIIDGLKDGAPLMFDILTLELRTNIGKPDRKKAIKRYREATANYVVLLDRLEQTFTQMELAFKRPNNPVTLAALAELTGQLKADVSAFERAFAALN